MPRSARSAALLVMHRRPSSRKRVSAVQRLRLYSMALPVSLLLDTLARCSPNQARMSGQLRSVRTATRCGGARPLISRSMVNSASMRATASLAIGAWLILAKSKNLRQAWHGPNRRPRRSALPCGEPGIGDRLHQSRIAGYMLFAVLTATIAAIEEHRCRRIGAGKGSVVAHIGP